MVVVLVTMGVAMVGGVKVLVWTGAIVNMSGEVLVIVVSGDTFIGVFDGVVIAVLADVGADALIEVVVDALATVVGVDMLVDAEIIVVAAVGIVLKFVVPVSYTVDMLSDTVIDVLIEVLTGVWARVIVGVAVTSIGTDAVVGVNVNIFADVVTTLRGATPETVEELGG